MNIHINNRHLIILGFIASVLLMTIFIGYPKYQEHKNKEMLLKFLEVPVS